MVQLKERNTTFAEYAGSIQKIKSKFTSDLDKAPGRLVTPSATPSGDALPVCYLFHIRDTPIPQGWQNGLPNRRLKGKGSPCQY